MGKVIQFPITPSQALEEAFATPAAEIRTLKNAVRLLLPYRANEDVDFAVLGIEQRLQQVMDEQGIEVSSHE